MRMVGPSIFIMHHGISHCASEPQAHLFHVVKDHLEECQHFNHYRPRTYSILLLRLVDGAARLVNEGRPQRVPRSA